MSGGGCPLVEFVGGRYPCLMSHVGRGVSPCQICWGEVSMSNVPCREGGVPLSNLLGGGIHVQCRMSGGGCPQVKFVGGM